MRPLDPRLLPHLAPARRPLAGMLVAGVANGLLLVAQAFALGWLVAAALGGDPVLRPAVALAATVAGRALASAVVDVCAARAGSAVSSALRRRVLAAALRRPSYDAGSTGGTALLATRGMTAVEPYLTRYLPALLLAAVLPAATVVAIATQDWLSALVVVLTLPLVPVFAILLGLATRNRADRQWRQLAALSGHFVDVVRGLPTLVAYRRAEAQSGRIREITHRYRRLTQDTLRLAFASSAVLELVATLSVALVAVTVGLRLAAGSVDLRTALVVLLLAPEAYWPLRRVGAEFHAAAEGTATFERAAATTATAAAPPPVVAAPDGALVLTDATAGYPGRPVLAGTSVRVAPRGLTAVTGPSGCGKSTLLAVLTGQLPVSAGSLGVPAPDLATWQAQVAWLPQRPWLVPGSVRANVCLGRPDATDAEVWRALERVHLADHVAMLPDGLDAALGEDGAGFSAGERARLALARVVVADRPWVFLDEPTAHLDADTEAVVAQTLTWLARTRAVVVVAHRESLVALADHVVTLAPPVGAPVPAPAAAPPPPVTRSAPPASPASDGPASSAAPTAAGPGPGPRSAALPVALGAASAAAGVALTATAGWLIARAAEHPPVLVLMVAIVGVRTFGLARPVLRYAERLLGHDRALALLAERRAQVYDALVPLVPGRLGRRRGDVLAGVVDDVDALLDRELRVRAPVWTGVLVGVLATAVAAWLLPAAGAVVAAGLLVGGGAAYALARRGARDAEPAYVAARAGLSDRVTTALQGAPDLVMWQAVDGALDRVDASAAAMATAVRRSTAGLATGRAAAVLAAGAGVLAVVLAGLGPLHRGELSGPVLALLALLPLALLDVVAPLADAGALSVRTEAAAARLDELAATPPAVTEAAVTTAPRGTEIVLDAVDAGWGERPVLRDLSLRLPPGRRLGVVGPSGCGKSTLAALLLRFLDPTAGSVRLGQVDLRGLRLDDVRGSVGLLDDDPHVFASTLAENVRLARPAADDAEVETALRQAHLGPWLDGLPDRLGTMLGDGYASVSGGERARIGLARAVLAGQPVLVLDEPTAHLDTGTAHAVAEDLLAVPGRSVVWVTHSTVGLDRMDEVLDLGAVRIAAAAPA